MFACLLGPGDTPTDDATAEVTAGMQLGGAGGEHSASDLVVIDAGRGPGGPLRPQEAEWHSPPARSSDVALHDGAAASPAGPDGIVLLAPRRADL